MIRYVFRNRYVALLWSALVCWQAISFVGQQKSDRPTDLYAECLQTLGLTDSPDAKERCACFTRNGGDVTAIGSPSDCNQGSVN